MSTTMRLLWFSFMILIGVLVGLWAQQFKSRTRDPVAFQASPLITIPAHKKKQTEVDSASSLVKPMALAEMDEEFANGWKRDSSYRLRYYFDNNSERSIKSDQLAADYARPDNYQAKLRHLRALYEKENNDNDRRRLYHDISIQRLYCLEYELEIARRAGLISSHIFRSTKPGSESTNSQGPGTSSLSPQK